MLHIQCDTLLQWIQKEVEAWRDATVIGLKEIRKKKGYSQLKVAMDLNISREAISYYETRKRDPDIEMLLKLSAYFNVSIDYLITGTEFNAQKP